MQNAFLKHFVFVVVASFSRDNVTMKFCSSGKVDEQFFCQKNIYAQKSKQHAIEQPLLLLLLLKKTPIQQKLLKCR